MSKAPAFPEELIEFFRKEGRKGGKATAKSMTPEQRTKAAKKAAQARWKKAKQKAK